VASINDLILSQIIYYFYFQEMFKYYERIYKFIHYFHFSLYKVIIKEISEFYVFFEHVLLILAQN